MAGDMLEQADTYLNLLSGFGPESTRRIIWSVAVLLGMWLVRMVLIRIVMHRTEDVRTRYLSRKTITYVTVGITIAVLVKIWLFGGKTQSFQTFLGLLSAGVAIALRDIIANAAGWLFIIWVKPLEVGDRIQIGVFSGDVVDISLFHVTIMEIGNWVEADQSTGRVIRIPNSHLFTQALANYSKGFQFIWNEIPVLVTFESDWKKAKGIMENIANTHAGNMAKRAERHVKEASRRFFIYYSKLTPIVYTSVQDSGVLLTIRYLCEPRRRRGTAEAIWEDILTEFADHDDIDFAYPTTRLYNNIPEGKSGTVPERFRQDNGTGQVPE